MDRKTIIFTTAIIILELITLTLLIGLSIDDSRVHFLPLIPLFYLTAGIFLLYFQKSWTPSFLLYLLITFICTYFIQLANVKTNLVYGQISYGTVLGPKVFGVPILATFNRCMLIYCVGLLVKRLKIKYDVLSSLLGALILFFIGLLAEPVASSLKFRAWTNHMSPLQNYGGRFVVSFLLLYFFNLMDFPKKNKMYLTVFLTEVCFLLYLNIAVI